MGKIRTYSLVWNENVKKKLLTFTPEEKKTLIALANTMPYDMDRALYKNFTISNITGVIDLVVYKTEALMSI